MLLIKSAIIISLVTLVLAVIVIRIMMKGRHSFEGQKKAVRNQYPSLHHDNESENQP